MDSCCESKAGELARLRGAQARVLYGVLGINGALFVIEFVTGWLVGSTALLADSLDMFGDATVYVLTLYALNRSEKTRAGAALIKSLLMFLFGLEDRTRGASRVAGSWVSPQRDTSTCQQRRSQHLPQRESLLR